MDENINDINNSIIKKLLSTAVLSASTGIHEDIAVNGCLENLKQHNAYTICHPELKLIPNEIAKKLHEAIAFGGEAVKRSLTMWYTDPDTLETMTALVDTCVAYIGEEVTEVLRKHSTI